MNNLRRFIEKLGRIPVIPLAGFPGIQLTGKTVRECLFDAPVQIEALLALYEEVRPDAVFAMMDLTVEAEYLGCHLKVTDNDPPSVADAFTKDQEQVEALFENKTVGGRMPLFAEVVNGLKCSLDVPVCAYVIGPFTLAGEIMDLVRAMKATRKNPEQLHRILEKSTELIIDYISMLEAAGADLICVLEPSAMMISSVQFQEFSGQYCRKIFSEGISSMSVLHICGDTNHLISQMAETGPDGLSLDRQVNLPKVCDQLDGDMVVIGNVDPVSVVTFGNENMVKEKSEELIRTMRGKENFILSTGCDIPQTAPIGNIKAMMSVKGP